MTYLSQIRAHLPTAPRGESPSDRRIGGRIQVGGMGCSLGEIINISGGGILVERSGSLGLKRSRAIQITLVCPLGLMQIPAEVVRVERRGWMRRRIALRFLEINDTQREQLAEIARSSLKRAAGFD